MKKTLVAMLILSLLSVCFTACVSKRNDESKKLNSLEKIKKEGKITYGVDDSYPPMEFRDKDNKLVGFDTDLGEEIAKKLGVTVEPITTEWSGVILSLKSGKFDMVLSTMSITEERKKEIDFSEPYIEGGQVIVVKKDNKDIQKSEDLKGKILACQLGSTGEEAASKIKEIKELKKYDKITEAFHDLKLGRVEAIIVDGQVGGYYIKKEGGGFEIVGEKLTKEPVGIGFRKEDKELREAVQKALDDLKSEGVLSKLSEKWFGYDIYK